MMLQHTWIVQSAQNWYTGLDRSRNSDALWKMWTNQIKIQIERICSMIAIFSTISTLREFWVFFWIFEFCLLIFGIFSQFWLDKLTPYRDKNIQQMSCYSNTTIPSILTVVQVVESNRSAAEHEKWHMKPKTCLTSHKLKCYNKVHIALKCQ